MIGGDIFFFEPHPPSLLYYGSFFVAGYVLHEHRTVLSGLAQSVGVCAVLTVSAAPAALYATHIDYGITSGVAHAFACATNALCTWAMAGLFIGVALLPHSIASGECNGLVAVPV